MRALTVSLTTQDNLKITGNYIPGNLPFGVILLHMMPATKESYDGFAEKLSELGFYTLAIDLRGHGQSEGGDYQSFTPEQHQAKIRDVEAAVEYLRTQNPDIKIGFVGASIGANLAVVYASEHGAEFVAALSAGLNYYGVDAFAAVAKFQADQPVYFASAQDDIRKNGANNAVMTEQLYNNCASHKKTINIYQAGGHGTDLFATQPALPGLIIDWIKTIWS